MVPAHVRLTEGEGQRSPCVKLHPVQPQKGISTFETYIFIITNQTPDSSQTRQISLETSLQVASLCFQLITGRTF